MSQARIVGIAIALQAIAGLALGLPGHLSADSVVQLYEARTLHFISFQPPAMSLLLRLLDSWGSGTALFVVVDQLLLTASFVLLFRGRASRLATGPSLLALVAIANPVLLIYTGIVWKDVLMAHLVGFGYVCLHAAATRPAGGARRVWVLAAVAALALGASLRQHALVFAIAGAVCAALLLTSNGRLRWGLALVLPIAVIASNVAIVGYADAIAVGDKIARTGTGLRSLALFDLAGIAANGGAIPDPEIAAQVNTTQVPFYTPLRNDPLPVAAPGSPLWRAETTELLTVWKDAATASPRAYLAHRAAHFWSLLSASGSLCAPVNTGIVPSVYVPLLGRDIMPELGLHGRKDLRDQRIALVAWYLATPLFNPGFWLAVVAIAAAMMLRHGFGPLVLLAMCAIVFTLGYSIIGISCEFRYLYVLPLTGSLLVLAAAVGRRSPFHAAPIRRRNGSIGRSTNA